MDIELVEIRDFLARHHPFDMLPREVLDTLPGKMETGYARRGKMILEPGQECRYLSIVRSGAVEVQSPEGKLLARMGEGETFGIYGLLEGRALNRVTAIEDTLFYQLPANEFERLGRKYPQFSYFFAPLGAERLRHARAYDSPVADEQLNLMTFRTSELLRRDPVTIAGKATIREAAQKMRSERVSALLVTEGDTLSGIVTDRDLRNRVLAEGLSTDHLVEEVMTPDPHTLDGERYAFDALLTMTRENIRHLPVLRGGRPAGVITNTDLIQKQTISAVYLVGDIYKRRTYEGLADVVSHIPQLLAHLVGAGATARNVGYMITCIADATTLRLLQLAEEKLGPPPVPYLWLASGSQARQEQTGLSDQDNCMILDDAYDEDAHGDYFRQFADFVCDGLNACGYVHCPGDVMAKNPTWRQPLRVWRQYFSKWIEQPEPKALMLSSIFFDLRPIHGEQAMYKELQAMILNKAQANRIFIAHMVRNALTHTPPLGFFRNIVLIRGGEHKDQFDLKHTGVVPIVDIARIYALEAGIAEVNTYDRLLAEQHAEVLSEGGARDLLDAYEFISITRLKHQARQIRSGRKPDNFMAPRDLSDFERSHLKDAFSVVKTIQSSLASAHQAGVL